jgi:hypothetical protein
MSLGRPNRMNFRGLNACRLTMAYGYTGVNSLWHGFPARITTSLCTASSSRSERVAWWPSATEQDACKLPRRPRLVKKDSR